MDFSGIEFNRIENTEWENRIYPNYVFSVKGKTLNEMKKMYAEQGFATVGEIYYGKDDKLIGIELIYHWNKSYATKIPDGLKEYLDKLVSDLQKEKSENDKECDTIE